MIAHRYFKVLLVVVVVLCGGCSRRKGVEQKSTEELLEDLSNGSDEIRAVSVRQLGAKKGRAATPALLTALKDQSETVRLAAAKALGQLEDTSGATVLLNIAHDRTQDAQMRLSAASALAGMHDPRAVDVLIAALEYNWSEASSALTDLGSLAIPSLIDALLDASTRENARMALAAIGSPATGPLINVLHNDPRKYAKMAAVRTLAEIGDSRASDAITEALKDSDGEMVVAAYRLLIRRGQRGSEKQLIDALNTYNRREMAEDFVSSGNPALKAAVDEWAKRNPFQFEMRSSRLPEIPWGGVDPGVNRLALFHFDGSLNSVTGSGPAESSALSFEPGKWGSALLVSRGGKLKYPVSQNLNFQNGTIEMWVSPVVDGSDPIYAKYNHVLLLCPLASGDQFVFSQGTWGGFYAGTVVREKFTGVGGGSFRTWKAGSWHHIAFTYSFQSARQSLYLDGHLAVQNHGAMPVPYRGAKFFMVGSDPWGNWTAFKLDELQISSGEKGPDSVHSSAVRGEPFADR